MIIFESTIKQNVFDSVMEYIIELYIIISVFTLFEEGGACSLFIACIILIKDRFLFIYFHHVFTDEYNSLLF